MAAAAEPWWSLSSLSEALVFIVLFVVSSSFAPHLPLHSLEGMSWCQTCIAMRLPVKLLDIDRCVDDSSAQTAEQSSTCMMVCTLALLPAHARQSEPHCASQQHVKSLPHITPVCIKQCHSASGQTKCSFVVLAAGSCDSSVLPFLRQSLPDQVEPHVTGQAGMTCTWKGQHATAAPGTFPVLFSHSIPSDPAMLQQPATVTCYSVGNIAVRLPSLGFGFLASILIWPPASWQAQAP